MAPNARILERRIVQIANPFGQPVYKLEGSSEEPSAVYYQGQHGEQELDDQESDEPSFRITTRARFTYELDRYNKNEMLIINNNTTDPAMIIFLLHAFQGHNFEFTYIETASVEENVIRQKIYQFFQKDFSNIGMVAVVTSLTSPGARVARTVNPVEEWDVLNYFTANQPVTLQGRPKIFISEAPEPSSLPQITSLPSDTLLIQTKKLEDDSGLRPLAQLCFKLVSMTRARDLLDIVSELKYEGSQAHPTSSLVKYLSTMSRELLLEKNVQDVTRNEWKEDFASKLSSDPNLFKVYQRVANSYLIVSVLREHLSVRAPPPPMKVSRRRPSTWATRYRRYRRATGAPSLLPAPVCSPCIHRRRNS